MEKMGGGPICMCNYLLAETFFIDDLYFSFTSSLLVMVITYMISHMLKMWLMPIYVPIEL